MKEGSKEGSKEGRTEGRKGGREGGREKGREGKKKKRKENRSLELALLQAYSGRKAEQAEPSTATCQQELHASFSGPKGLLPLVFNGLPFFIFLLPYSHC